MFIAIAALMVFWLTVRTVKFTSPPGDLGRYCWYLYYIPMLFIPLLANCIAFLLGRPEGCRLPAWTGWLYAVTGALFLLVLTNDIHRLVFVFPEGKPPTDLDYSYGPCFIPVAVWQYGGLLATLGVIFARSRLPGRTWRLLVPVIPAGLLVAYNVIYLMGLPWLRYAFGDMTATECMLVICILESCARTGLIQSNTHYGELFRASSIRAAIVDADYREYVSSTAYESIPEDTMRRTEDAPVMLEGGRQLSGAAIAGGHVLWQRDLTALTEVIHRLDEVREELADENAVLVENYRTERQIRRLEEQNRLYDEMHRRTADRLRHLEELVEQFERSSDDGERLRLLHRMQLVGVYLKRRDNLILIGDQEPVLKKRELELCFEETIQRLESCGVESALYMSLDRDLTVGNATALYDFYETVLEAAFDGLTSMLVRIYENEGGAVIAVTAMTGADLSSLAGDGVTVLRENGGWTSYLRVKGGG